MQGYSECRGYAESWVIQHARDPECRVIWGSRLLSVHDYSWHRAIDGAGLFREQRYSESRPTGSKSPVVGQGPRIIIGVGVINQWVEVVRKLEYS